MQQESWIAAGALLAVAVASGVADHRRRRRADMDRVGWVPWPLVQILSLIGALVAATVAMHS
ncbi:MAG: hypothetical protein WDN24_09140 [Sphingomonas sp.]